MLPIQKRKDRVRSKLYLAYIAEQLCCKCRAFGVQPIVLPACGVGALHRRYRVFIVANDANRGRGRTEGAASKDGKKARLGEPRGLSRRPKGRNLAADPSGFTREILNESRQEDFDVGGSRRWGAEPGVGRVVYGVPNALDRLTALGNAVMPNMVFPILKAIADLENA